jgi:tetratricopeptide (TPR) repeat protein
LLKTGDQNLVDPALRNVAPPHLPYLSPEKRLRSVLDLLLENIECLSTVANGSSGAAEAAITEARLIAEQLQDTRAIAQLMHLEGRMWFERNSLQRALALHEEAESLFSQMGCSRDSSRAENLIRQAICLRRVGLIRDSIDLLWKAARLRPLGDWTILNRVRSNLGAAFLYVDWSIVRYHWERQLRHAVRRNLNSRRVHALASLSFIDLFEGKLSEGFEKAKNALELGEKLRFDGQILRLCLHLSVHSLLTGRIQEAKTYLLKAEELAMRHGVGRRLWRVTANLATVDELLGDSERAFTRDSQVLRQLSGAFSELRLDGREMLPLVNMALRAARNSAFEALPQSIPERFLSAAESYSSFILNGQKHRLPGLLGNYCAELSVGPRLLLSE